MTIIFYPDVDKTMPNTGVSSEISWQRLHDYLEAAFNIKDNERLSSISVSEYGIKANIDKIKKMA